jgi:hypothetical protein
MENYHFSRYIRRQSEEVCQCSPEYDADCSRGETNYNPDFIIASDLKHMQFVADSRAITESGESSKQCGIA